MKTTANCNATGLATEYMKRMAARGGGCKVRGRGSNHHEHYRKFKLFTMYPPGESCTKHETKLYSVVTKKKMLLKFIYVFQ